ncbi:MAG TPA: DUF2905 domain-containing protein [Tepidisphaeraceae bacterium]|jgi:hypothetical protein
MTDIGKVIVLAGLAIAAVGVIVWMAGRAGFHGLPGDIAYRGRNVSFYFPIVSSIVLSILLTLGIWIWRWLSGR